MGPRVPRGVDPLRYEPTLTQAFQSSYTLARNHNITDLAVSALSTGVFGYPPEDGTRVMMQTALQERKRVAVPP